jgi:hypothetical protein
LIKENQNGAIFMEDLSKKMASLDVMMTLNQFQMKEILKHLAAFHAYLLKNPQVWKNKFRDNMLSKEVFINMQKMSNDKGLEVYPEEFKLFKKLEPAIYDAKNIEYSLRGCCTGLGLPSLLQLGDLWTNNLIWKPTENHLPNKVLAFIDFSLAYEGNPAFDWGRLIAFGVDAEVRREMETWIFDYYYENLTNFLGKKPDFEVEQFKKAYYYGFINQTGWMPMMTMMFPTLDQNYPEDIKEARMQKWMLRAKFNIEDAVKRLEELQTDWVSNLGA